MKNTLEFIKLCVLLARIIIVPFSAIFFSIYFISYLFFPETQIGYILFGTISFFVALPFVLGDFIRKSKFGYYSNRAKNYRNIKGPVQNVEFTAKYVTYNTVLDGDIIQILFEQDITDDHRWDPKKYLKILINYEQSPPKLSFEWYDGREDKRCNGILDMKFNRSILRLSLEPDTFIQVTFKVSFNIDTDLYYKIESYLKEFS